MKIYVVFEYLNIEDVEDMEDLENYMNSFIPFIVGTFSSKKLAKSIVKKFTDKYKDARTYFIEEYEVDNIYYKTEEELEKEVSESVEKMVKEGILDYKIGEDGQFYFEVIDKNKRET